MAIDAVLFKLESGTNYISFHDCKSRSIEVKTKHHHTYQVPEYFFEFIDTVHDIDSIIDWLGELNAPNRKEAIQRLNDIVDEMDREFYEE